MKYVFLIGAIVAEVVGALATKQSSGFTKPLPSVFAVFSIVGAYFLFSLCLKNGMQIGIAYGIWAALGITLLALIGVFFFKESLNSVQVIGMILIVAGVLAIELGR